MDKIILASQSPRRKQLLEWAEIPFEVMVKDTDESFPEGLNQQEAAMHIARNKALKVLPYVGVHKAILAADTIVVLGEEILGKPAGREDAIFMLQKLAGKKHQVITGVCILYKGEEIMFSDETEVEFHELDIHQVEFYVDNYRPYDKAGAYAIQEWIGVTGIKAINGDFYNVMGLPVSRVIHALKHLGL